MKKNHFKLKFRRAQPLPMSVNIIFALSIVTNFSVAVYIIKNFL
ncbi:MAG TPA: hypothetical protein VL335_03010 [Candidatus Paceibacterota bacterium]|nr:hypothetical protein [Candidatus Paceibacterota bacterium]